MPIKDIMITVIINLIIITVKSFRFVVVNSALTMAIIMHIIQ